MERIDRAASPRPWRARSAAAAARIGSGYTANREMLEPLARLLVDLLAVAALLNRRPSRPPVAEDEG